MEKNKEAEEWHPEGRLLALYLVQWVCNVHMRKDCNKEHGPRARKCPVDLWDRQLSMPKHHKQR